MQGQTALAIGQSYQGGVIAYLLKSGDPGYIEGQEHGLVAAYSDLDSAIEWGCYGTNLVGAKGTELGTGAANTKYIMDTCVTTTIAARICGDWVHGGYSDWYLPSKMELYQLYLNREKIGDFSATGRYWSSSQNDANGAWQQIFNSSLMFSFGKAYPCRVRPVRSF